MTLEGEPDQNIIILTDTSPAYFCRQPKHRIDSLTIIVTLGISHFMLVEMRWVGAVSVLYLVFVCLSPHLKAVSELKCIIQTLRSLKMK